MYFDTENVPVFSILISQILFGADAPFHLWHVRIFQGEWHKSGWRGVHPGWVVEIVGAWEYQLLHKLEMASLLA